MTNQTRTIKSTQGITMVNQTNSIKRTAPAQKKSGAGIKALIMAASLAATIGGWGILAIGQTNDALATTAQPQALVQSASPAGQTSARTTNQQTTLRQVPAPVTQPRAVARTRSSR